MNDFRLNNILIPEELPLIALKNTVLFPKAITPIVIQRPKSTASLEQALLADRLVFFGGVG